MNKTSPRTKVSSRAILSPPFNNIAPYFSAVIYNLKGEVSIEKIVRYAKLQLNRENTDNPNHYYYFDEEFIDDRLGIFTVCQKSIPSWLLGRRISRKKEEFFKWENHNTHLAIIYKSKSHLFLTCKNSKVLDFFQNAIYNLDGSIISKVSKAEFQKTQAFHGNEAKVLGLKNTFGTGNSGKIPESKAYTGKDCKRSLNGVTDHVFKLSHIGSTNEETGYSGASVKKRKVWGGWTNSMESFIKVCDSYAYSLNQLEAEETSPLQCLAQPSDFEEIKGKKPIAFNLDSVINKKGVLCLKIDDEVYTSWYATLTQYDTDIIEFKMWLKKSNPFTCKVKFFFNEDKEIEFEYSSDNNLEPSVIFMKEDSTEPRGRDLVKYLNSSDNFTLLFSGGLSYSKEGCYKMEKIVNCFFDQASTEISWSGVDITKEEAIPINPKLNILQKLEKHSKTMPNLLFAINDNGANEVSDLILIFTNKIVFVHAKASK